MFIAGHYQPNALRRSAMYMRLLTEPKEVNISLLRSEAEDR